MENSYFENIKNTEPELYNLATYAESLYKSKFFQSVPNAVRFYLEELLPILADKYGTTATYDTYNQLDMSKTISNLQRYYDPQVKKILHQCQSNSNAGSHADIGVLEESQYKENAKTCLKCMSQIHRWFSNTFYNEELPIGYSFPEIPEIDNYEEKYNEVVFQYDSLEQDYFKVLQERNKLQEYKLKEDADIADKKQAEENKLKYQEMVCEMEKITLEKDEINHLKIKIQEEQNKLNEAKKIFEASQKSVNQKEDLSNLDIWEIKHENARLKAVRSEFENNLKLQYNLESEQLRKDYAKSFSKLKTEMDKVSHKQRELDKAYDEQEIIIKNKIEELIKIEKIHLERSYIEKDNDIKNREAKLDNLLNSMKYKYQAEYKKLEYQYNAKYRKIIAEKYELLNKIQNNQSINVSMPTVTAEDINVQDNQTFADLETNNVSKSLYDTVKNAIFTMHQTNNSVYITKNTIRNFLFAENTPIIYTYNLNNQKGYGSLTDKISYINQIDDILYYLEENGVVSSKYGYYKPVQNI